MTDDILTQEQLKSQFTYDSDTGIFTRKFATKQYITVSKNGAVIILVNRKRYSAHRLAWLYVYGEFPTLLVDHINGVRTDNRICNLRLATASQNQQNRRPKKDSVSGVKGISWLKYRKKWRVRCTVQGVVYNLGDYPDLEIATYAYQTFAKEHHGEFYRE